MNESLIVDYNNISPEICYKLKVWDLQNKFALMMSKYLSSMQFGNFCEKQLEHLKMFKRSLSILNRYDTRDIQTKGNNYNVISFDEIERIVNYLQNK